MERVAIYCRLSQEDKGKAAEDSESIQNQKALLLHYAREKGWEIHNIYIDEDCSGAKGNRPGLDRLLADAENRRFTIVLCKSQSRFARDMQLAERVIHHRFPAWGIRFVALVGDVDTQRAGTKKMRQINSLLDEWYLEDISGNTRSVLAHKRETGCHVGAFSLYGYKKDGENKNRLVIDPPAAAVVGRIFHMYLAGRSKGQISDQLNREGVPNPTRYKELAGLRYKNGGRGKPLSGQWSYAAIDRILREEMYTGHLVQGRMRIASYKTGQLVRVPPEEWAVVRNTHEAIIEPETFRLVQSMLKEDVRAPAAEPVHPLAGKIKCMDCGSSMVRYSRTYNGKTRRYLRCSRHKKDPNSCSSHAIRLDILEKEVMDALRKHIAAGIQPEASGAYWNQGGLGNGLQALHRQARRLQEKIDLGERAVRELRGDRDRGALTSEQFEELYQGFAREHTWLMNRLAGINGECRRISALLREAGGKGWAVALFGDAPLPPRGALSGFLDFIEVGAKGAGGGGQALRIHWMF